MAKLKKVAKTKKINFGTIHYPVGDFLIRVKNAAMSGHKEVVVRKTKLVEAMAKALVKDGFLSEIKKEDDHMEVTLAYQRKEPVILDLKLISKPGLRVYVTVDELEKRRKPTTLFISTPKGVLSRKEAIKVNSGGEAIVEIW